MCGGSAARSLLAPGRPRATIDDGLAFRGSWSLGDTVYEGQRTRREISRPISTKAHVSAFLMGVSAAVYAVVAVGVVGDVDAIRRFLLDSSAPSLESFLVHQFVHTNPFHLAANVLVLLLVSSRLETRWGAPAFALFTVFTTVGVALVSVGVGCLAGLSAPRDEVLGISYGLSGTAIASLVVVAALPDESGRARSLGSRHVLWAGVFLLAGVLALLDGGWLGGSPPEGSFLLPQISAAALGLVAVWLASLGACWVDRRRECHRRRVAERLHCIREQVDDLLDKIRDRGVESLTSRERMFLRRASRHFKNG